MQEKMLVAAQPEVASAGGLDKLYELLTSPGVVRRTHQIRRLKGKTKPAWFYGPRLRRSFEAVLDLQLLCTSSNLKVLLSRRRITTQQLSTFVDQTKRLPDGIRGIIETAIGQENARIEAGTNTGHTSELTAMTAGEPAPKQTTSRCDPTLRTAISLPTDGVPRRRRGRLVEPSA